MQYKVYLYLPSYTLQIIIANRYIRIKLLTKMNSGCIVSFVNVLSWGYVHVISYCSGTSFVTLISFDSGMSKFLFFIILNLSVLKSS